MSSETTEQRRLFLHTEVLANMIRQQQNFVGEDIDAERAANAAALRAGQLHFALLDDLFVERIEERQGRLRRAIILLRQEGAGDVVDQWLGRVFRHRRAPLFGALQLARRP